MTASDGGPGSDAGGGTLNTGEGGATFVAGSGADDGGVCGQAPVGGSRPVQVRTFTTYNCNTPSPLVILLHDYASSGAEAEAYFNFAAQADALGFLYAHPDGTKDSQGNEFWNATDACCNVDGSTVDDSSYLATLLQQIHVQFNTDLDRVYVFGYGNGGFMAYRFACDHYLDVAVVADLGGATWANPSKCAAKGPLTALEIHGTSDTTFAYDGGASLGAAYPSAPQTISQWVQLDRCDAGAVQGTGLDLLADDAGTDTTVLQWPSCPLGSEMQLWSIQGGTHQPALSPTFASTLLTFVLAHKRP